MGKAKRFNLYDETVKTGRERVKQFGELRQKLSVGSTFGSAPLQPPITTKIGGTGTGDGKFLTVSLSADQTTNIAANNHVEFDTKDEDGEIVLQTGAGQADGLFELLGGRKYYLQASLRPEFSGVTGQLEVAWYDQTNTAEIGSRAKYEAMDHSGNDANQPIAAAIVTPTTNILVKLEILSVTALDALANEYCHANLFEIALGGFGAGGGSSSGVSFPITPTIKDHGNSASDTIDLDLSASTGHVHKITLTGNPTLTFSNPPSTGTQIEFEVEFVQDATGGRTVTYPASVVETITISTAASSTSIISFRTNDGGTNYHAVPALRGSISVGSDFALGDLSNLSGVAINTSLISDADNTDDLGSASKEWKDLYIDGTANIDALSMGGDIDVNTFDVKDIDRVLFTTDSGAFAATTDIGILADASGDMLYNVGSGDAHILTISKTEEYNFTATGIEMNANQITESGAIIPNASDTYDLGSQANDWSSIWGAVLNLDVDKSAPTSDSETSLRATTSGMALNVDDQTDTYSYYFNGVLGPVISITAGGVDKIACDKIDATSQFVIQDSSTDPAVNGIFTNNAGDVKVFSGGAVRNLSDAGGASKQLDNLSSVAINADLGFGSANLDIGTSNTYPDTIFLERVRFPATTGAIVAGEATMRRAVVDSVNTIQIDVPTNEDFIVTEQNVTAPIAFQMDMSAGILTIDNPLLVFEINQGASSFQISKADSVPAEFICADDMQFNNDILSNDGTQNIGSATTGFNNIYSDNTLFCSNFKVWTGDSDINVFNDLDMQAGDTVDFADTASTPTGSAIGAISIKVNGTTRLVKFYST